MSTTPTALAVAEREEAVKSINRLSAFFAQFENKLESIAPAPLAPVLAHRVTDLASKDVASKFKVAIKTHMDTIEGIIAEPKAVAHKLHKTFTGLENFLLAEDKEALAHLDKQVNAFVADEDRKRKELEAELLKQAALAAKQEREAELARLEAERQKQLEMALPWETVEETPLPEPAPVQVPVISIADPLAEAKVRKPWDFEVYDIRLLCAAIGAGTVDPDCIQVNRPLLVAAARLYKNKLSDKFPGIRGVQSTRVKF